MGAVVAGVLALGAAIIGGIMSSNAADDAIKEQRRQADDQKKAAVEKSRVESVADLYNLNDDPVGRVMMRNKGLDLGAPLTDRQSEGRIDQIENQKALSWLPVAAAAGNVVGAAGNYASQPSTQSTGSISTPRTFNPTGAYSSTRYDTPTVGVISQPLTQQTPAVTTPQLDPQSMIPVEGTTAAAAQVSPLAEYGYGDPNDPYRSNRWRFAV